MSGAQDDGVWDASKKEQTKKHNHNSGPQKSKSSLLRGMGGQMPWEVVLERYKF